MQLMTWQLNTDLICFCLRILSGSTIFNLAYSKEPPEAEFINDHRLDVY